MLKPNHRDAKTIIIEMNGFRKRGRKCAVGKGSPQNTSKNTAERAGLFFNTKFFLKI